MIRSTRRGTLAGILLVMLTSACSEEPASAPIIASVQLDRTTPLSLVVGGTHQLNARAQDTGGEIIPTVIFNWTSSNQAVATVSTLGLVTAVAPGNARITVSAAGRSAGIDVEVVAGGEVGTAGGTIETETGATLVIPAGALPAGTAITVEPMQDPVANEHVVDGTVHEFGPDGLQFAQPVTLELEYDPASPEGTPHSALRIAKLIESKRTNGSTPYGAYTMKVERIE